MTALELLVALGIGAVLLTIAVPAFTEQVMDARLTAAVNRLVHGIHVARQEALKSGTDVVVCRSTDSQQCQYSGDWRGGLIVFQNRDGDDPPRVDAGERILQAEARFPVESILANRRAFVFRPWARSVNGTLTLCDRRGDSRARAVVVSYTGRPRATAATSANGAVRCPT